MRMYYSLKNIWGEVEENIAEFKEICQLQYGYLQGKWLLFAKCKNIMIQYRRKSPQQRQTVITAEGSTKKRILYQFLYFHYIMYIFQLARHRTK